jgi:hypothetical protein
VRHGLRSQTRDLSRIGAVERGLVESGYDDVSKSALLNVGSHGLFLASSRTIAGPGVSEASIGPSAENQESPAFASRRASPKFQSPSK